MILLLDLAEEAFVGMLTPVVPAGTEVLPGKNSGNKSLPCVICAADGDSVDEDPKNSGNFWIRVSVQIKSGAVPNEDGTNAQAADPKIADEVLVNSVFSALQISDLDHQLTAVGNGFTVFPQGWVFESPKSGRDEHGVWVDEIPLKVYCCSSAIPA